MSRFLPAALLGLCALLFTSSGSIAGLRAEGLSSPIFEPYGKGLTNFHFPEFDENGNLQLIFDAPIGSIYRLMGLNQFGEWKFVQRIDQLDATDSSVSVDLKSIADAGYSSLRLDRSHDPADVRERMEFYREKWISLGLDNYRLEQVRSAAWYAPTEAIIQVSAGTMSSVVLSNTAEFLDTNNTVYTAVEDLFSLIEENLDSGFDIQYDLENGYPKFISSSSYAWAVDAGFSYKTQLEFDSVNIGFEPESSDFRDPFTVGGVFVWDPARAILGVEYSTRSGCAPDEFVLYSDGVFMDTSPPRIRVFFGVENKSPGCVWPRGRKVHFDIREIVDLYQEEYGPHGPFLIDLVSKSYGKDILVDTAMFNVGSVGLGAVSLSPDLPQDLVEDQFEVVAAEMSLLQPEVVEVDFKTEDSCMPGVLSLLGTGDILESIPPQVDLYLRYEKTGDDCLGTKYGRYQFDISELIDRFEEKYGFRGQLIMNLHTVVEGEARFAKRVTHEGRQIEVTAVNLSSGPPSGFREDPFDVYRFEFARSWDPTLLTILMGIDGFCEVSSYDLHSDAVFSESIPVQVDLFLRHDSGGDTCEGGRGASAIFDMESIVQKYDETYGDEGDIEFNLYKVVAGENEFVGKVTYERDVE